MAVQTSASAALGGANTSHCQGNNVQQVDAVLTKPLSFLSLYAVEEGWPIVGMAPELVTKQFDVDHLFEKHGGPFLINSSFLGGRAVCVQDPEDISQAQLKQADVLAMTVHGVASLHVLHRSFYSAIFVY
jgi:hypothetical protein